MNEEKNIVHIPKYKKFWYSATKFEKYPEMAAEGVGRAFRYLMWLMFMFSVILVIGLCVKAQQVAKLGIEYLDNNFSEINYQNGELSVIANQNSIISSSGNVTINTRELTQQEVQEYESEAKSTKPEIVWLKDEVIFKYNSVVGKYEYKDILDGFGIKEFNKQSLINLLNKEINSPKIYLAYGVIAVIYTFIGYFLSTLLDILVLSFFGWLTTIIAKIQMRYRAIFNMSVYAITISTVLRLIYVYINLFTDFNIKYFDLMYTAISFICLAAAIFMIKSDVIRQQIELIKIIEKQKKEEQEEIEKKEEEKKEEKEEEEQKDNNTEKDDSKKEKGVDGDVEGVSP